MSYDVSIQVMQSGSCIPEDVFYLGGNGTAEFVEGVFEGCTCIATAMGRYFPTTCAETIALCGRAQVEDALYLCNCAEEFIKAYEYCDDPDDLFTFLIAIE